MLPKTYYAKCGDINIAYQVTGEGPIDVIYVPGWISNLDQAWQYPDYAHVFERLGSFARLIRFDKRGTGLSDRDIEFPTLEQRIEDVTAVMDAVGSERAVLLGTSEGGNMSVLFAATYPERTAGLILYGCFAKGVWAPDYPWAAKREALNEELAVIARDWGGPYDFQNGAPSLVGDEAAAEWFAAYLRASAGPKAAISIWNWNADIDVRTILPTIQVPTLVLHRTGDRWQPVEEGRYLAENIQAAKYIELPGDDHLIFAGDSSQLLDEIEEFVTGVRPRPQFDRVLLTVMFTDIVGSTSMASEIGDARWKEVLQRHDSICRQELKRHGGTEINTTGDGFLVTFEGPTSAVLCAAAIRQRLSETGIKIRAGLHTGECERRGDDVSGIAVHLTSRLMQHAADGGVVASRTVKDLVVGSGIKFEDRGEVALRDIPGTWQIFTVAAVPN